MNLIEKLHNRMSNHLHKTSRKEYLQNKHLYNNSKTKSMKQKLQELIAEYETAAHDAFKNEDGKEQDISKTILYQSFKTAVKELAYDIPRGKMLTPEYNYGKDLHPQNAGITI